MNTTLDLPMSAAKTHDNTPAGPATAAGVFADVVFDRPLDHAYSYAVPADLVDRIGVGKRVEAPFGRGDRATVGYCVRVHDVPPTRAVKSITRVLDDEALLTDGLLRLTRWMADYYLCGWGPVLNAVVPAGARDRAGTRAAASPEAGAQAGGGAGATALGGPGTGGAAARAAGEVRPGAAGRPGREGLRA